MQEIILSIFLIINNGFVVAFKVKAHEMEGGDDRKIKFLKDNAYVDYETAQDFIAPQNEKGEYMKYKKFALLEKRGMQYILFEDIFKSYNVPQNPIVCVTPVVDGKIFANNYQI